MAETKREILEQARLPADEIACVSTHQAHRRFAENLARDLTVSHDLFFMNLNRSGTTSVALMTLTRDDIWRAPGGRPDAFASLVTFGAGLTYGAALVRW